MSDSTPLLELRRPSVTVKNEGRKSQNMVDCSMAGCMASKHRSHDRPRRVQSGGDFLAAENLRNPLGVR